MREHAPQRDLAVPGARRQIDRLEAVEHPGAYGVREASRAAIYDVRTP